MYRLRIPLKPQVIVFTAYVMSREKPGYCVDLDNPTDGSHLGQYELLLHRTKPLREINPDLPLLNAATPNAELIVRGADKEAIATIVIRYTKFRSDQHYHRPIESLWLVADKWRDLPDFGYIPIQNVTMTRALIGAMARCIIDHQSESSNILYEKLSETISRFDRSPDSGIGSP